MRKIGARCNLIPVISKGDSLTESERVLNKELINKDIERESIKVFQFDTEVRSEDEAEGPDCTLSNALAHEMISEVRFELQRLQEMIPFCIMNSIEDSGLQSNTVEFPWGTAKLDEVKGNELHELSGILLTTHTQEFKDITNEKIYEEFRSQKLQPGDC